MLFRSKVLKETLDKQLAEFRERPEAVKKFLGYELVKEAKIKADGVDAAELSAWAAVASLLLNLDETVTKG